jgi:hypothetical protein
MECPIDEYQVRMAKMLIEVIMLHCLNFPQPVVIEAFRQKLAEMEQETIGTSR